MNWKFYQRLGTIYEFLERLEVEKPDLGTFTLILCVFVFMCKCAFCWGYVHTEFCSLFSVKLIKIGKTNYGRDMVVVKIGRRQNYDKPGIFIESGEC